MNAARVRAGVVATGAGRSPVGEQASSEMQDLAVNETKIAVKLGVAVLVATAAVLHRRAHTAAAWLYTVGALTIVNVVVAVFWR